MPTLAAAAKLALALPDVVEGERHGHRTFDVRGRTFAWERPFSKADVRRFGTAPVPVGPILAVRVADLAEKEATLAEDHPGVFTIPHFDTFAAVLVDLPHVSAGVLRVLVQEAWLAMAPPALGDAYLARRRR